MNIKKLVLTTFSICALGCMTSCQNELVDEPMNPVNPKDGQEWSVDINLPEDYRTRAAAVGSVGSDGLYQFSRNIDRVWYSVYYNGAFLYHSDQALPDIPQAIKKGDKFSVLFKFEKTLDPTKIWIFFWAGNKEDNVTIAKSQTSSAITLNFENRCVAVDPKYMNGDNAELKEFDSFAGYFQLSNTANPTNFTLPVTLKRPFAQIHVLSDEFKHPGVSVAYPGGVTVVAGFGSIAANSSNYSSNLLAPNVWYFDTSLGITPAFNKNEFGYMLNNYEFTNTLSATSPERVTFKSRLMDYMGCFYTFAPVVQSPLKYAQNSGNTSTLGYLNLAFRKIGSAISTSQFANVALPSEGIKANNRYVIYNKLRSSGDDDPGSDFITNNWILELSNTTSWENGPDIEK